MSEFRSDGPRDYARAVEIFVRSHVVLVDEPEELLIDPSYMLAQIEERGAAYGDCDDAAMLTAVLLYAVGLPTRFKAIQQAPDGAYQHVFTEYQLRGLARDAWIPVDTTIKGIPIYNDGDFISEEL